MYMYIYIYITEQGSRGTLLYTRPLHMVDGHPGPPAGAPWGAWDSLGIARGFPAHAGLVFWFFGGVLGAVWDGFRVLFGGFEALWDPSKVW